MEDWDYENTKLDAIQSMLKPLGAALGVEYSETTSKGNPVGLGDEPLDVDQALAIFGGGKGTVVNNGK